VDISSTSRIVMESYPWPFISGKYLISGSLMSSMYPSSTAMPIRADVIDFAVENDVTIESREYALK
jgi:hypothetical protein